jgi:hypothetical protein
MSTSSLVLFSILALLIGALPASGGYSLRPDILTVNADSDQVQPLYEHVYWRTRMSVVSRPPQWDPVLGRMRIGPGTEYRVTGAEYVALLSDGRFTVGQWESTASGDFALDGRSRSGHGTFQLLANGALLLNWSSGEQSRGTLGSGYEELTIFGLTFKFKGSYIRSAPVVADSSSGSDTGAPPTSALGSPLSDAQIADALRYAYAKWPQYFVIGKFFPTEAEKNQGAIVGVSAVRFEPHRKTIAPGGVQRNGTMYPMEVSIRFSKGHAARYNVNFFRNDSDGAFLISVNNTGWNRVPSLRATP